VRRGPSSAALVTELKEKLESPILTRRFIEKIEERVAKGSKTPAESDAAHRQVQTAERSWNLRDAGHGACAGERDAGAPCLACDLTAGNVTEAASMRSPELQGAMRRARRSPALALLSK